MKNIIGDFLIDQSNISFKNTEFEGYKVETIHFIINKLYEISFKDSKEFIILEYRDGKLLNFLDETVFDKLTKKFFIWHRKNKMKNLSRL